MITKKSLENLLNDIGVTINGPNPADIRVHDPILFQKMKWEPILGAGEGYMEKLWDCDRIDELFCRLTNKSFDDRFYSKPIIAAQTFVNLLINLQNKTRSKQVAEQHYNLGNAFYQAMLGESMAYTCGYWKDAETLEEAQLAKFELICQKLKLQPNDRVLDIGCGWGTLAKYMVEKYHCTVDAVNISVEQVKYGKKLTKDFPINFYLCDYRDDHQYNPSRKRYDKIVSVGLFEHVGKKNYRTLFDIANRNLSPEGLFLLHTIGKSMSIAYANSWVDKYIFPNGFIPSLKQTVKAMEGLFTVEDLHNFGDYYDKTLMAWYKNFVDHWDQVQPEKCGNPETFYRLWKYYLLSCAGCFRSRSLQLWQFVLSPHGVQGGYISVR